MPTYMSEVLHWVTCAGDEVDVGVLSTRVRLEKNALMAGGVIGRGML